MGTVLQCHRRHRTHLRQVPISTVNEGVSLGGPNSCSGTQARLEDVAGGQQLRPGGGGGSLHATTQVMQASPQLLEVLSGHRVGLLEQRAWDARGQVLQGHFHSRVRFTGRPLGHGFSVLPGL